MFIRKKILKIFRGLGSRGGLNFLPSEVYIKILWYLRYGKKINLNNPKTFNEKIQWLKLYDHNEVYKTLVDKSKVKNYISNKFGAKYIIKTLWEGKDPNEIPYDKLPSQFVIKCTHGSHCNIICKDKYRLNKKETNRLLKKWLKKDWFWYGREWVYKGLKPSIMIEEYMEDKKYKELPDYKIYCFNGEPKIIDVCTNRYSKDNMCETYMDENWNYLGFLSAGHDSNPNIMKPKNFNLMINLAKQLSKGFKFIRVDLYEINGQVYFGELTFYSANGFEEFEPEEWNYKLGNMIDLSD